MPTNNRSTDGWWISVNKDGSGSYGFGTGLARVKLKKDTFSFERVFTDIEKVFVEKPVNGEETYMAVSYWRENISSATGYYMALDRTKNHDFFGKILFMGGDIPQEDEYWEAE